MDNGWSFSKHAFGDVMSPEPIGQLLNGVRQWSVHKFTLWQQMLRMRACRVTVGRRSLLQLEFLLLLLFQEEAPRLSNSEANNASLAWSTSNLKSLVIK